MLLDCHRQTLVREAQELGLANIPAILSGAHSCYFFELEEKQDGPVLGSSRFSGTPDLPVDCSWADEITGLIFLLQVNLASLDRAAALGLPSNGFLYYFSGQDAHEGRVFYHDGKDVEFTQGGDPEEDYIFSDLGPPVTIKPRLWIDLPDYGSDDYYALIEDCSEESYEKFASRHRIPHDQFVAQLRGCKYRRDWTAVPDGSGHRFRRRLDS